MGEPCDEAPVLAHADFAILTTVFLQLLIFLRIPFSVYALMSYQDALDVLTPLVRRKFS